MKKRILWSVIGFVFFCLTACEFQGATKKVTTPITLTTIYDGATIDLCTPEIRTYLEADTEEEQIKALLDKENKGGTHQNVSFEWESNGSDTYTLYVADNAEFEDAYTCETKTTQSGGPGVLMPGTTYYWKVVGDTEGSTSRVDTFQTLDAPARFITTQEIPNVRDMGGWKTAQGQTVRYGMFYRGGRTNAKGGNTCAEADVELFANTLGVKTEIDLRTEGSDDGNQTKSVFGDDVFFVKTTLTQFNYIYPDFEQTEPIKRAYDKRSKYSIKELFRLLADEENYPVYIHCNAGADRTGTVAFLINGVLGVSYEDLTRDFELTQARYRSRIADGTFAEEGVMQDDSGNYIAWDKMYQVMMRDYGTGDGMLSSAIQNYLVTVCKVSETHIEALKTIVLE